MRYSSFFFLTLWTFFALSHLAFAFEANPFLNGASSLLNQSARGAGRVFKEREFAESEIKVKVGGEFRYRFEYRDDFNLNPTTFEDDSVNLLRSRLNLDVTLQPSLRFLVEGQEAHSFAESQLEKTNAFVNELDLRQLFIEVKSPQKEIPFTLKVGRQELAYGDERLVGAFNWSNVSRVFDAVKLIYQPAEKFQLDLFVSRPVRVEKEKPDPTPHQENFYGIYGALKLFPEHVLDTFLLICHNRDKSLRGERSGEFGPLKEYTLGNRFKGKAAGFDYGTEYAIQLGSRAHDEVAAWAFHQEAGYKLTKLFRTPRLSVEFNHASGDRNPSDGTFGTFDNLFPTNHDKYGFMDFLSLKNINDVKVGVSVKLHPKVTSAVDLHWFFLDAKESAWFNASGGIFRAANSQADTQLGEELDLTTSWRITEPLSLWVGFSHFFAGPFAQDTGASDDANFFYVQNVFSF